MACSIIMNPRTKNLADAATGRRAFAPNYAVAPGATIAEALAEKGMLGRDLAARLDVHEPIVSDLIAGKRPITAETARGLELVLGIPMQFWLRAEAKYREHKARIEEAERYLGWADWVKGFPFAQMVAQGWLPAVSAKDVVGRVKALLGFLQVASPEAWEGTYDRLNIAYRKTKAFPADKNHLGAWLRQGEVLARQSEVGGYDKAAFERALATLRQSSRQPCGDLLPRVRTACAQAGVTVVYVPALPKSRAAGATRWLTETRPTIQLSLRGKKDDQFWFTFLHESAHVLLHGHKEVFVDLDDAEDPKEIEANTWAADFLVKPAAWAQFVAARPRTKAAIATFAAGQGIPPGIVVGRLQREARIAKAMANDLKQTVDFDQLASGTVLDAETQAAEWTEALGAY